LAITPNLANFGFRNYGLKSRPGGIQGSLHCSILSIEEENSGNTVDLTFTSEQIRSIQWLMVGLLSDIIFSRFGDQFQLGFNSIQWLKDEKLPFYYEAGMICATFNLQEH